MFQVNTRNTRTKSGICSKLTIKTPNDANGSEAYYEPCQTSMLKPVCKNS